MLVDTIVGQLDSLLKVTWPDGYNASGIPADGLAPSVQPALEYQRRREQCKRPANPACLVKDYLGNGVQR